MKKILFTILFFCSIGLSQAQWDTLKLDLVTPFFGTLAHKGEDACLMLRYSGDTDILLDHIAEGHNVKPEAWKSTQTVKRFRFGPTTEPFWVYSVYDALVEIELNKDGTSQVRFFHFYNLEDKSTELNSSFASGGYRSWVKAFYQQMVDQALSLETGVR